MLIFNVKIEVYIEESDRNSSYLTKTTNIVVLAEDEYDAADQAFCTIHNRMCNDYGNSPELKEILWENNHTKAKARWDYIVDAYYHMKRYIIYKFNITQVIESGQ